MGENQGVDVGAILSAAYRRPVALDQVAGRVRARLALLETAGEVFRLLFEASGSALTATLGEKSAATGELESGQGDECGEG